MPPRAAAFAVLTAAIALAACQPQGHGQAMQRLSMGDGRMAATTPAAPAPGGSEPAAANRPPAATAEPGDSTGGEAAPRRTARREPPDTPPAAATPEAAPGPEIDPDPERFLGIPSRRVAAQLGAPAVVRRDPPAQVWQYRTRRCVLDVFLYPQSESSTQAARAVLHLEARDRQAQPVPAADCLERLLRSRLEQDRPDPGRPEA